MNQNQAQITKAQLKDEQRALKEMKKVYEKARQDVEYQISALSARTDMENAQSIAYQVKYQKAILKQIEGTLDQLNNNQYDTLQEFWDDSYNNGYIGSVYDLSGQGIPITVPIDPKKMSTAIMTKSKLSKEYYQNRILPENLSTLKRRIRQEITRGIASGMTWNEVAWQVAQGMNSPFNKALSDAMRIIRTEGHRINQQGFLDASEVAIKEGADIVKQWDATLDGNTRPDHQMADGQIREIKDFFDVGGEKMKAPGIGGSAKNVCNCRCQLLQRARWALDQDELDTLKARASYFGLDKTKDFDEFKKKYLKISDIIKVTTNTYDIIGNTTKLHSAMNDVDYNEYMKILNDHENDSIKRLYAHYADKILNVAGSKNDGYYSPAGHNLVFSYPQQRHMDNGMSKFSTLAHEYGHFFDAEVTIDDLHFNEVDLICSKTKWGKYKLPKVSSSSDEFLLAVRKDREWLKANLTDEMRNDMRKHDGSAGVQDAIDGLLADRIAWGHGDKYYNRKYHGFKAVKDHKGLQDSYKELGMDASNLSKTARECRVYESASEMWANIISAEVNGGEELEYVKKYLPNSYNSMLEILKGVK